MDACPQRPIHAEQQCLKIHSSADVRSGAYPLLLSRSFVLSYVDYSRKSLQEIVALVKVSSI